MSRKIMMFSRDGIRRLDRDAINRYGIPEVVLMENAARSVAHAAATFADPGASICIVCGKGNNGADGLAAARHLANDGFDVSILLTRAPDAGSLAALHASVCRAMKIRRVRTIPAGAGLIVDALYGTGLSRALSPADVQQVNAMNSHGAPILAVDIPSGLDADTGNLLGACVHADLTVTFVGPKQGMMTPLGAERCGDILIGDTGAPAALSLKYGRALALTD